MTINPTLLNFSKSVRQKSYIFLIFIKVIYYILLGSIDSPLFNYR